MSKLKQYSCTACKKQCITVQESSPAMCPFNNHETDWIPDESAMTGGNVLHCRHCNEEDCYLITSRPGRPKYCLFIDFDTTWKEMMVNKMEEE